MARSVEELFSAVTGLDPVQDGLGRRVRVGAETEGATPPFLRKSAVFLSSCLCDERSGSACLIIKGC